MANIGRRYSWTNDKYAQRVEYSPTLRQYQELCSISDKDNPKLFENTVSPTNIISRGFYQSGHKKPFKIPRLRKRSRLRSNTFRCQKENSIGFSTRKQKKS